MIKRLLHLALASVLLISLVHADPDAQEIVVKVAKRDKELQQRRKNLNYNLEVIEQKLDDDKKVISSTDTNTEIYGDKRPGYAPPPGATPQDEVKEQAKEEPFNILNVIDHFSYDMEGEETILGVPCYKIHFAPKGDQPYHSREEKVVNAVAGYIWAAKSDYTLMKNTGSLTHPVSVAWFFASLRELEFRYDAQLLPNGDYGPKQIVYRFKVSIPFGSIHERHEQIMTDYEQR